MNILKLEVLYNSLLTLITLTAKDPFGLNIGAKDSYAHNMRWLILWHTMCKG